MAKISVDLIWQVHMIKETHLVLRNINTGDICDFYFAGLNVDGNLALWCPALRTQAWIGIGEGIALVHLNRKCITSDVIQIIWKFLSAPKYRSQSA
jgi:hypothetical protein